MSLSHHMQLLIFTQEYLKKPESKIDVKFSILPYRKFHTKALYFSKHLKVYHSGQSTINLQYFKGSSVHTQQHQPAGDPS